MSRCRFSDCRDVESRSRPRRDKLRPPSLQNIQWAPLNVITLGLNKSYNNNRSKPKYWSWTISKLGRYARSETLHI
jgi:hypothetical protein